MEDEYGKAQACARRGTVGSHHLVQVNDCMGANWGSGVRERDEGWESAMFKKTLNMLCEGPLVSLGFTFVLFLFLSIVMAERGWTDDDGWSLGTHIPHTSIFK